MLNVLGAIKYKLITLNNFTYTSTGNQRNYRILRLCHGPSKRTTYGGKTHEILRKIINTVLRPSKS